MTSIAFQNIKTRITNLAITLPGILPGNSIIYPTQGNLLKAGKGLSME